MTNPLNDSWDAARELRALESTTQNELREALAPYVDASDLEGAIDATMRIARDFAGRFDSINERQRVRDSRERRQRG